MKKARKRLRICLIAVVLLAVVVGCAYYFGDFGKEQNVTEGTLVRRSEYMQDKNSNKEVENVVNVQYAMAKENLAGKLPGGFIYGWQ